jgi:serine/threonine protein phosphatase PrpC
MDVIDENDFDHQIGFWIQDTMYIYIQKPKNIFESSRIYLADPQFFRSKLLIEPIFYNNNQKQYSTLNNCNKNFNDLSIINSCLENVDKDMYRKLFKKYFSVWNSVDIESLINIISGCTRENYQDCPEVSIRYYDSVKEEIKILYTVSFLKNGTYKIDILDDIGTFNCLTTSFSIKRNVDDKSPIRVNLSEKIQELSENIIISNITFFNISDKIGSFNTSGGKIYFSEHNMKGRRPTMEDQSLACKFGNTEFYMFAVLDGHGGQFASKYFSYDIPKRLYEYIKVGNPSAEDIKNVFLTSDRNTWYTKRKNPSGTCFSGVLITKDKVYVINLGDSRTCVYYKSTYNALTTKGHIKFASNYFITKDHNPDNIDEKKHIEEHGGYVSEGRVNRSLMVSRALGDFDIKTPHIPKGTKIPGTDIEEYSQEYSIIVSPIPDVNILDRKNNMHIIIHCDGLNENGIKESDLQAEYQKAFSEPQLNKSEVLCLYAYKKGSTDNLSAITLHLE